MVSEPVGVEIRTGVAAAGVKEGEREEAALGSTEGVTRRVATGVDEGELPPPGVQAVSAMMISRPDTKAFLTRYFLIIGERVFHKSPPYAPQ